MNIDLRHHDQHEYGTDLDLRLQQPVFPLAMAQEFREKMRAQGLRVPFTDAEKFAQAEARMRGQQ